MEKCEIYNIQVNLIKFITKLDALKTIDIEFQALFQPHFLPCVSIELPPRPVILEARSTVLEKRSVDPLIEDIAHSVLTGGAGKGLGGSFSMDASSSAATAAAAMSNNLLRNR